MSDVLMTASIVVAVANIVMAIVLVSLYGRIYAKTKAPFTAGLLLFAVVFLLQNGLVAYSYGTMMALVPDALAPYLLGVGILESAGLASVLWTATR